MPLTATAPPPQWIATIYVGAQGLDHLGLGSVSSDQILQSLSPGVNVQTVHPRYHSFYAFLLDEYWRQDRRRSSEDLSVFLRARESIFSIGAGLCEQPEHQGLGGVVGSQQTAGWARERRRSYDSHESYMESKLGGYGLYYRAPMILLEWVWPGGRDFPIPVDAPTERGKRLAEAFRDAIRETDYYKRYFAKDEVRVPLKTVRDYIAAACLCQARRATADRALLRDAFLSAGEGAQARRQTLRLFLDIASQTAPLPLEQPQFRQLVFFGASDAGHAYRPSRPDLVDVARRWRLYQAREYYAFALNRLWAELVTWGLQARGDLLPIPLSAVWAHLDEGLALNHLARALGLTATRLSGRSGLEEVLAWLAAQAAVGEPGPAASARLEAPLQEDRLYSAVRDPDAAPAVAIGGMILMLLLTALRFGAPAWRRDPAWAVARMGESQRLSLDVFLNAFEARRRSGPVTLSEIARWILNDLVIVQHQLIAAAKPENTFRFRREGDRLRFFNLRARVAFSDSRFTALTTTLLDLGWTGDFKRPDHGPTPDGRRLLAAGEQP